MHDERRASERQVREVGPRPPLVRVLLRVPVERRGLADAQKCIAFTKAFGEFLFVLPARVERGRKDSPEPD